MAWCGRDITSREELAQSPSEEGRRVRCCLRCGPCSLLASHALEVRRDVCHPPDRWAL